MHIPGTAIVRAGPDVILHKNVLVPMRDGVSLAADLYVPDGAAAAARPGPWPVVMDYIPYRKDELGPSRAGDYLALARAGYVLARVDIRGTGASEGVNTDEYTLVEQLDGYDAIEWFATQPWCDGHVNMIGISYGGFTALQVAAHRPPHLTSIIPVDFTDDRYTDDCHYRGGLLRMYYDIGWYGSRMIAWGAMPPYPEWSGGSWAAVWEEHLARNEPYLLKWLANQVDGPYWRNGSVRDAPDRIACPTFLIGGWRDGYPNPPLRLYAALTCPKKVLVGPWNHAYPNAAIPGPRIDHVAEVVRWLDHWCRGIDTGIMDEPPVVVYMQRSEPPVVDRLDSAGAWRAESAWPAPGADEMVLHLAPGGRLDPVPPGGPLRVPAAGREVVDTAEAAKSDTLVVDPTVGVTGGLWSGGIQFGLPGDQRRDEALSLVYSTEPLGEELHILGWARAVLHVAASAPVAAVAVSLSDVAPDGSSHLVAKGMLNGTRRSSLIEPEPMVPGEVYELAVEIDCAGWTFSAGNRIRIAIAGADFPNVWPTPHPASITVHHGQVRPSRLVLPTVPAEGSATPPVFRPSPIAPGRHRDAHLPPTWQVTTDVLTGRVTTTVKVAASFRVDTSTVIEREWASVCSVDPAEPGRASASGWHVCRSVRPGQVISSRTDTTITSTEQDLHVTIDLDVRVNDAPHHARRWVESYHRQLL